MRDRKLSDQTLPSKGSRNPSFTFRADLTILLHQSQSEAVLGKWIVLILTGRAAYQSQ